MLEPKQSYKFVGGSHDGNTLMLPHFEIGFTMGLDTIDHSGKKEVYRLREDGKFHYLNAHVVQST